MGHTKIPDSAVKWEELFSVDSIFLFFLMGLRPDANTFSKTTFLYYRLELELLGCL